MKRNFQNIFTIFGIIGPIFFTILMIILGALQQDYNHIQQYISELGAIEAPNANIMNYFGFTFLGLSIILFGFSFYNKLNLKIKIPFFGFNLILISGLSFFLIGFFPCDKNCINITIIGIIHGHLSNIAQFSLILAPIFFYQDLKKDFRWNNYKVYFLLTTINGLIFGLFYKLYVFDSYIGLLQRISFAIPLIWVVIISIKLLRLD